MLLLPLVLLYQVSYSIYVTQLSMQYYIFVYLSYLSLIPFFHFIGSNAETRRSNYPGAVVSNYPNDHHMTSKNVDNEKSPDPYLLGRLMGSSYANYPSAFSIASRGVSNQASSQQVLLNQNIPSRGINIKSSEEPIYVPGAYMVNFNLLLVP